MARSYSRRRNHDAAEIPQRLIEPRLGPDRRGVQSEVFDTGSKTIVDCAHVRVERLDTHPVLFSKVFKEYQDGTGQKYDYRYWAERENFFLREFLKKQHEYTHVVQPRHLISENEAAKQVLTCDAGITIANWLRVKTRYADTATLSHPFQRSDTFLHLLRACLTALKQIHVRRIVHCDIKEDNICIPYAPHPFPGDGRRIRIEFERLKLIDFAFSVADAIPLTQVLVINPDERLAYQSELLISALHADRRSGSPNAVQQLDYRVDLFSLGYMAEKISAAGLDCPPGYGGPQEHSGALDGIRRLVHKLKAFDTAPAMGPLPHDDLIAEIDRLLVATAGLSGSLEFTVDGEWTAAEMEQGRGAGRKTPLTPVALPLPTPVAVPLAPAAPPPRRWSGMRMPLLLVLALAIAGGGAYLYWQAAGRNASPVAPVAEPSPQPPTVSDDAGKRIVALLHSEEELVFQAGYGELARLMAGSDPGAEAIAKAIAGEYGDLVESSGPRTERSRALNRLKLMANAGNDFAAQRVAAFEKEYDDVKQMVAKSDWWVRGLGSQPQAAAQWLENGALLAANGDRPAMLDVAFATGHGRALARDRVAAVETYLKVIARADGGDQTSTRIRQSALHGLAAMLNIIVVEKDGNATQRLVPALEARANTGAADVQYYLGLMSECVARPANLDAARQWYRKAAADPAWRRAAVDKARLIGRWCPRRPT